MGIPIDKLPIHLRMQAMKQLAKDDKLKSLAAPAAKPAMESPLEVDFLQLWIANNGPELEREVGLIPGRLFRVDFLHRSSKTVIEIQGIRAHTSRKGFARDNEKFFILAVELGYRVVTLDKPMITEANVKKIIALVTKKT